ncbi:MAG: hypothetical protein QM808_17795 [Steroidobacteraceae bacterium]
MLRIISVVVLSLSIASCVNVVRVKEKTSEGNKTKYSQIGGIPFYIKKQYYTQTTAYADTWYKVTLTAEKKLVDSKEGKEALVDAGTQVFVKNVSSPTSDAIVAIKQDILNANNADVDKAMTIIKSFDRLAVVDFSKPRTPELIGNSVEATWIVDSDSPYYLNAPLPWFGSANFTQELNTDGTLSKATSNPDTKLAEAITSLIPFKEFLTGKFVKSAPAAAAADTSTKTNLEMALQSIDLLDSKRTLTDKVYVIVLSLSVDQVGYEYALSTPPSLSRPTPTAIPFASVECMKVAPPAAQPACAPVAFTRKEIAEKQPEEKKDEGQKIGITGSIQFPKDWGASEQKDKK